MQYYLAIAPAPLTSNLVIESKRLMKIVYNKSVRLLYYRVKTKRKLNNHRRLFLKGDGKIIEMEVKPHLSLVHHIDTDNPKALIKKLRAVCKQHRFIELKYKGVGNYGMDFTFYVQFKKDKQLNKLRNDLLKICKEFMTKEELNQHHEEEFVPHATILYDDINPKNVLKAYKLVNKSKFMKNISVNQIALWEASFSGQKVVARFKLRS